MRKPHLTGSQPQNVRFFNYFTIFVVMEAKYWFYIIIGGIYVLSRFLKKSETPGGNTNENESPARDRQSPHTGHEKPKTLTFEELLQQITEAKEGPKPVPATSARPVSDRQFQKVDYDDDLKDEAEDLEEIETDYRKRFETYEEGKKTAFNRRSLEETLSVQNTNMTFGKFAAFEQGTQRNLLDEYTKQFQDPEGLRKAIVMAEILNRKF
jgi:hypothetical protein